VRDPRPALIDRADARQVGVAALPTEPGVRGRKHVILVVAVLAASCAGRAATPPLAFTPTSPTALDEIDCAVSMSDEVGGELRYDSWTPALGGHERRTIVLLDTTCEFGSDRAAVRSIVQRVSCVRGTETEAAEISRPGHAEVTIGRVTAEIACGRDVGIRVY
jgi:hypothetical protein